MHTTESKWQDAPLELAKTLEYQSDIGAGVSELAAKKAAAMIRSLVQALEQKMRELDSLEPSE